MKATCLLFLGLLAVLCVSCSGTEIDTSLAKSYQVMDDESLPTSTGRTARAWHIVSDSSSFEEHAQTIARALLDLHREHGAVVNRVELYPSRALVGSGVKHGYGFYATDGRAGQGFPGADPDYRATWRVFATDRRLTEREVDIAELWMERARDFPSQDPFSSLAIDADALRLHISAELGLRYEDVVLPHPRMELWLEVID